MRRIVLILGICMAFLASCSSSGPTGDPENDAKQFAKEMFSAFNSENVEKMAEVINTYYEFYKDKKGEDIKLFFDTWKDELGSETGLDEEKFSELGQKADKDGKMEELYRKSLK